MTKEAHGDAVVEMGLHLAARDIAQALAAGGRPHSDQRGLALVAIHPVELQAVRNGGQTVDLLDRGALPARSSGCALGEGGGDREHRIFVDHRRGALLRTVTPSAPNSKRADRRHPRRRQAACS